MSSEKSKEFKPSRMAEILEKVVRIVPGVGHYQDKEKIRNWDKELRLQIAARMEEVRRSVELVTRDLADAGDIKSLKKLNDINNKIDRVRDTIKFASYGYAGIFDPKKIREPELMRHYEFDLQVAEAAEGLENILKRLQDAAAQGLETKTPANQMIKEIEDLESFFRKRHDFLVADKAK